MISFIVQILRARIVPFVVVILFSSLVEANEPVTSVGNQPLPTPPAPIDLSSERSKAILRPITPSGEPSTDIGRRSALPSPGTTVAALAAVVLLILAAARLWRKHGPHFPQDIPVEAYQVLGRCRLESRRSVFFVRVGCRLLVIGSGEGELTTLSEITDPSEVESFSSRCRQQPHLSRFGRLFEARRVIESSGPQSTNPPDVDAARDNWTTPEEKLAERFRTQEVRRAN